MHVRVPGLRDAAAATIVENARVYTMDPTAPRAEAIAWRDGRVLAVGTLEEVYALADAERGRATVVDAGGRAVIPGLIDAHIHLLSYARSLRRVDLEGARSKEEALARVEEKARQTPPGHWVLGGGWNNNRWSPPLFPSRADLDRVAPNHPVVLDRKDLHSCWINSEALRRAGITSETPDPPGARIGKDAGGEPDGMLYESAVALIKRAIDEPDDDHPQLLREGMQALVRMGVTAFHDCEGPDAFAALQALDASGEMLCRGVILLAYPHLDEAIGAGLRTGFGSEMLRVGPVKIFSDGSLGSVTAEMLEAYEGMPGIKGIGTIPQSELEEAIMRAGDVGIPSAVHAIGDAANRRVLDAFERARERERVRRGPGSLLRHRIEHAQLLHPDDIPRFAALRVAASMQPIHCTSDMQAADRLWGGRARYSYAWRSLLRAGALVCFGSDAPVETPNPFAGIHAAVTRQDEEGSPPDGWYPQERISVEEAVRAYTFRAAASAPYFPTLTGTLTERAAADLLVLDRDMFSITPHEIKDVTPAATVIAGRAVYDPQALFAG